MDNSEPTVTKQRDNRAPSSVVARNVVYYIGGAIVSILAIRFLLQLLGANEGNAFVDLVFALSSIFLWPFYGIFGNPSYGQVQFETSTLFAMLIYGLLTVGIANLFSLRSRRTEV